MANPEPSLPKAEEKMTRLDAQIKLGLFATVDVVAVALLLCIWIITGFYWCFRPEPNFIYVIGSLLFSLVLLMMWTVVLLYRVSVRLLDIQADINLMPEASARIVLGYYEGRKK